MTPPRVSIFMAVHNGASWLADVLDSIAAQSYSNIELTVCDSASTDGTADIIRSKVTTHNLRHTTSPSNIGFWASMERLIATCNSPYIMCLTDVVLHPAFVAEVVSVLESDQRIGAVQGKIYAQNRRPDGTWERGTVIDALGFELSRGRRVTIMGHGQLDIGQFDSISDVFGVEGAVPVFRREALEHCRVQGFVMDPDFRIGGITYADDFDLSWRMRLLGWRQVMAPQAIGWHDRSTSKGVAAVPVIGQLRRLTLRGAVPLQKRRLDWSNVRFAIIKNDSILSILKDLPYIVARECAVLGYTVLFEPAVLVECGRFFRLLPSMLRKRHEVQRKIV